MTKIYPLRAEIIDASCFSRRPGSGLQGQYESLSYIPGRAMWGGLANYSRLVAKNEKPSPEFMDIFYSDRVVFSNLYPEDERGFRSKPIPLSARTKKKAPGFLQDRHGTERCAGVDDWLIKGIPRGIEFEDIVKLEGFYVNKKRVENPSSYFMHHERDTVRKTVCKGKLYSRVSVERGSCFAGYIKVLEEKENKPLEAMLEKLESGIELSIGRKPGRISVTKGRYEARVFSEDLGFSREGVFTVTCVSDTILIDKYHRYYTYIPQTIIQEACKGLFATCELEHYFSAPKPVFGWNGAWQRPMETELAVSAGSAFRYRYVLANGKTGEDFAAAMKQLALRGLGLRRSQGFGENVVNDSFHDLGEGQLW